ncbi:MAG: hypothetical protein CMF80_00890, partial [Candidatus Marinimicrobia bacterium]|nr:hypothetical protein [Candidatus Neomarinimicrobiota bacterium]
MRLLISILSLGFLYADCEDFLTEADCGMQSECEWHADDNTCEDAGHDHGDEEHCEDFLTEADCGMHS